MGVLRQLLSEELDPHRPSTRPTELMPNSPESLRKANHPALKAPDPIGIKANAVIKVLNANDFHPKYDDVKSFIATMNPKQAWLLTARDAAIEFLKKTGTVRKAG